MPDQTMPTSEVLNRAADLIEERGWGQGGGTWAACEGAICIDEAVARALGFTGCNAFPSQGGIWPQDLDETAPSVAIREYLDFHGYNLYHWNDSPGRTASEVIEVLRACAVIEASREREAAEVSA